MVSRLKPLIFAVMLTLGIPIAQDALAQIRSEVRSKIIPFGEIKRMVDSQIGGRMIGGDFDEKSYTYQLRYMRGTELVDVVVDARSGRILGRRESM